MKVTDLHGKEIEVKDLDEAIIQTAQFMEYSHVNPAYAETDKNLKAYWTDLNEKLNALKKLENGNRYQKKS